MFGLASHEHKALTFRQGLWILALVYTVLATLYLIGYQGIPYVFDNNESFSSIVHAKNLIQFDFFKSFGLTDESYGLTESSHPYVYTHQGNFPRIFAALLYVLGLQSIEWQIIAHAVIINSIALYLAYYYFAKKISPVFALIYCLILLTDYVMNFQWLFNTWRVWHCLFMFSSLILVEKYQDLSKKTFIFITLLNFACLAYFELAFAIFVIVLSVALTIITYKNISRWLFPVSIAIIGAILGFGLLIAQDVLYFGGFSGFLNDLNFTFTARNQSPPNSMEWAKVVSTIWDFVDSQRLVFWGNFVSTSENLRSPLVVFQTYIRYNLMVYSPFFLLILAVFYLSILFKTLSNKIENSHIYHAEDGAENASFDTRINKLSLAVFIILIALGVIFFSTMLTHLDITNLNRSKTFIFILIPSLIVVYEWLLPQRGRNLNISLSFSRFLIACGFLIFTLSYGIIHGKLFELNSVAYLNYYHIWWKKLILFNSFNSAISKLVFISSLIVGVFVITSESLYQIPKQAKKLYGLLPLIAAAGIAILCSWLLIPGYILSAYFTRYAPMYGYINILIIVIPLYIMSILIYARFKDIFYTILLDRRINAELISKFIRFTPIIILYLFIIFSWIFMQLSYYSSYKNSANAIFKLLQTEPYKNKSVVANTYSAPFSIQTNQWSYYDPEFSSGRVNRTQNGYFYGTDDKYLWLADKNQNNDYRYPDYFICFFQAQFDNVTGYSPRCDLRTPFLDKLIRTKDESNFSEVIRPQVVAQDADAGNLWAIVKLDNDFPPFILPKDNQRYVDVLYSKDGLKVDYQYKQQKNIPESNSRINLYKLNSCQDEKNSVSSPILSSQEQMIPWRFFQAGYYQVSVSPGTKSKKGEIFWSQPFSINNGAVQYCKEQSRPVQVEDLQISAKADGRRALLKWVSDGDFRHFEVERSKNGASYAPLALIDGEKRDLLLESSLYQAKGYHYRIRSCTDWACSSWVTVAPN
jgi:hypothetical protein